MATLVDGRTVKLVVQNVTAYNAYDSRLNGLKYVDGRSRAAFGTVNVKAPTKGHALVQLRFTFVDGESMAPVSLERTFVSFYDFDEHARACLQVKGHIVDATTAANTALSRGRYARGGVARVRPLGLAWMRCSPCRCLVWRCAVSPP